MAVLEEMERRLRQELRWLRETRVALEVTGVAAERPDAVWELEREEARIRRMLRELERTRAEMERGGH